MIIRKVTIENYLCYYGVKELELSDGLNIILGENGEGKTKFFEALEWLFTGENRNLSLLVSAKALAEAEIDEQFRVRVAITVEQYGEKKIISKSFIVKKLGNDECATTNYSLEGIEENRSGERSQVDGKVLLERVFPTTIRRYSLFKGEAELNIFKNDDALLSLINSFSSAKHYEKYSEKGEFLRERAERAVDDATRNDNRNRLEYKRLEAEIARLSAEKNRLIVHINSTEEQITKTQEHIHEADRYVSNAEALETINGRINEIERKISSTSNKIFEKYTTALFDENWMLVHFEKIHHEFSKKISEVSNKRRELQTEFDKEIGIKEGKRILRAELLNNAIPLPTGVPSKAIMEEMLRDHICKVCNRPAEEGSDAYIFMQKRLEEYLKSQEPEEVVEEDKIVLFKHNFINRLTTLCSTHEDNLSKLRGVKKTIKELFEFNKKRKEDLEELDRKLKQEIAEREKVIGNSSIGAEKLTNVLKNYNGWQRDINNLIRDLNDKKDQLKVVEQDLDNAKEEKDGIDTKTANTFLIKTREILRDIEKIFNDTKDKKFDEFIIKLQEKSNSIFKSINVEAFTGKIVFKKKSIGSNVTVKIELQESDGKIFYMPNQSLLTSMHISILFAISELATELREESYPMVFDAPTSSFGETKTSMFLNLIYENRTQKILLVKDFLVKDKQTNKLSIKPEFSDVKRDKAFWVLLERPFDEQKLSTLNTQIITL